MNETNDIFGPVIFRYTRKQAIDDGMLVDLTEWARETGFKWPVACTRSVWDQYIVPPEGSQQWGQTERGRAHDMLWMLFLAIKRVPSGQDLLHYEVLFLNEHAEHDTARLKAHCGPGDEAEPVLTIMLPHED